MPTALTHDSLLKLSIPVTEMVHLLQLMNLHSHIITTQSPQFTSELTLGVVHSMGLDKCIMPYINHNNMQNVFTALKILCVLPVHPTSTPSPATSIIFLSSLQLYPFQNAIQLDSDTLPLCNEVLEYHITRIK